MKKQLMKSLAISATLIAFVSCKDEKKNVVTPSEAKEVAQTTETSITYQINTEESSIKWLGSKPTGEHYGTVNIQEGWISLQNGEIEGGEVSIDMNSITVLDEGMDEEYKKNLEDHLKGTVEGKETDFFNVNKYPTATFHITGTSKEGDKTMLEGNLTMKDKSHNISFPVNISESADQSQVRITSEPFTIDRTHWGVNYGSKSIFDNLGDKFINDEMQLEILVSAKQEN